MRTAQQMQSLPDFFADIPDPRRAQGRRHQLSTVLDSAAGATLCGMRGYLVSIHTWSFCPISASIGAFVCAT